MFELAIAKLDRGIELNFLFPISRLPIQTLLTFKSFNLLCEYLFKASPAKNNRKAISY